MLNICKDFILKTIRSIGLGKQENDVVKVPTAFSFYRCRKEATYFMFV